MVTESIIYLLIGYAINLVIVLTIGYFLWKTTKMLIKESVREALREHEQYIKNKPLEAKAIQNALAIRKKYSHIDSSEMPSANSI